MAVKLRLTRKGKKKQPTYRIVAADSRSPRDGRFIEIMGFYDPRPNPSVIKVDNEKALKWLRNGAQPSERVKKLLIISGAWTEFTGEAPPVTVTAAGSEDAASGAAVVETTDEVAAADTTDEVAEAANENAEAATMSEVAEAATAEVTSAEVADENAAAEVTSAEATSAEAANENAGSPEATTEEVTP